MDGPLLKLCPVTYSPSISVEQLQALWNLFLLLLCISHICRSNKTILYHTALYEQQFYLCFLYLTYGSAILLHFVTHVKVNWAEICKNNFYADVHTSMLPSVLSVVELFLFFSLAGKRVGEPFFMDKFFYFL